MRDFFIQIVEISRFSMVFVLFCFQINSSSVNTVIFNTASFNRTLTEPLLVLQGLL